MCHETLLPKPAGLALRNALAEAGVRWHLDLTARHIEKQKNVYTITLNDGTSITADLVLSAVGLRPDIKLATMAGLELNRGVVSNRLLQSNAPDIYALGDIAEVDGKNLPFVAPLIAGAKVLAKTLTGEPSQLRYPAMPVVIKKQNVLT